MSTTYAGNPSNNPTSITIPSDGDGPGIQAADVNVAFEGLADQIAHMRDRFTPLIRLAPFRPSGRIVTQKAQSFTPSATDEYRVGVAGNEVVGQYQHGTIFWETYTASSSGYVYNMTLGPDLLIDGSTLTDVTIRLAPKGGHGGLPQVMPGIYILRSTRTAGSLVALKSSASGWSIDAAGSVGAYEAAHDLSFTADQNNTIDHSTYVYTLIFHNEGGTNSLAQGVAGTVQTTHTRNNS